MSRPKSRSSYHAPNAASPLHRSRYLRHKLEKVPLEEIAKQDGVALEAVQASIRQVGLYYQFATESEVQASELNIILATAEKQKQALLKALEAKKPIITDDGKVLGYEDDHVIALEAVGRINEKFEALSPKGRSVNTQVNVGVIGGQAEGTASGGTFEERLRVINKNRANSSPPLLIANTAEAVVVEEDEEVEATVAEQVVAVVSNGNQDSERPLP